MNKKLKIPKVEVETVLKALKERHKAHLRPGEGLTWGGALTHGEAEVAMVLANPEETEVLTLESRVDLDSNDIQNPSEGKDLILDFVDEALQEYFSTGRQWRPPLDWAEYDYKESRVWLRGSVRNVKLERMANELLGH